MAGSRSLTPVQERALIGASRRLSPRDHLIVCLLLFTGMRCTDLLRLRFGDIWWDGAPLTSLRIPTHPNQRHRRGARDFPILSELHRAIHAYVQSMIRSGDAIDELPLFRGRTLDGRFWRAQPLNRRQVHRILRRVIRRAGLQDSPRLSPMSLRKTLGCKVYARTKDILLAREVLGHVSAASTCEMLEVGRGDVELAIMR